MSSVLCSQCHQTCFAYLHFQASCLPAFVLSLHRTSVGDGDVIDCCAAPGNKTSHAAALFTGHKCVAVTLSLQTFIKIICEMNLISKLCFQYFSFRQRRTESGNSQAHAYESRCSSASVHLPSGLPVHENHRRHVC